LAAAVARAVATPQAAALEQEMEQPGGWPGPVPVAVDELCSAVLRRTLTRIDSELPWLAVRLFPGASAGTEPGAVGCANSSRILGGNSISSRGAPNLTELYDRGALKWASREPGVNVYTAGGEFLAHTDGHALTVLVPLSHPARFSGGGTGFWHPDARGHRVEPPALVLKPDAGTALLFCGHVEHAGVSVERGERVVLVASFSTRPSPLQ